MQRYETIWTLLTAGFCAADSLWILAVDQQTFGKNSGDQSEDDSCENGAAGKAWDGPPTRAKSLSPRIQVPPKAG